MTRPRSQQINNLKTRHFRFAYVPTPGALSDAVADGPVFSSSVTGVAGGSESQVTATVTTPTTGPFPIVPGDSFSIALDGGGATVVVLAGTDTTASRIAAAVIAATGLSVASASAGFLSMFSLTPGSGGSVTLADVVPGVLTKLGIVPGTVVGSDPPVRGVVTKSSDGRGGYVVLKTSDGKDLVTDTSSLMLFAESFFTYRSVEKPGGVPLHARLTRPSGFAFKYYASLPTRAEFETFGSNFALLDGTDTFSIEAIDPSTGYDTGVIVMTFPAGPGLTRDQVVTRINSLWATAVNTSTGTGEAKVTGTISGPYTWDTITSEFEVSVDGGAFQSVQFQTTDVSAILVASRFNGSVTGATASVVAVNGNDFVHIASDNTDGTTSSLELRNPSGFSSVFSTLGMQAGKHRGYFVCQPSGPSEIRFFGVGRGSQATVDITGSATTHSRMGITAGVHTGLDDGEEEVSFPEQNFSFPGTGDRIVALIPEVMDFGEVPDSEESVIVKFGDRAPGTPVVQGLKNIYLDGLPSDGRGVSDSGKPPIMGADGSIQPSAMARTRAEYENFFKKFIRGDFQYRSVSALVAANIETPGTAGNPGTTSAEFTVDVDPDDAESGSDRLFQVRIGRDATAFTPFSVQENSAGIGLDWLVSARDTGGQFAAFANAAGPIRLYDANTDAGGTAAAGPKFLKLTSSTAAQGDRTLRIMEKEKGVVEPATLIRQINAKWVTTVGDGTRSFGDFNGVNAIQQAIAFFNTHVGNADVSLRIQLKHGIFDISGGDLIDVPDDVHLILEGQGRGSSIIRLVDATSPAIRTDNNGHLELRNVRIEGVGFDFVVDVDGTSRMSAFDILSLRAHFRFDDGYSGHFERCSIFSFSGTTPLISILAGNGIEKEFTFLDCDLTGGNNLPILKVGPSGSTTLTPINRISFVRNKIRCGSATVDANNNLIGNSGVIDVDPGTTFSLTGATGPYIQRVEWIDCNVTCNRAAGTASVLMHLIPIANGSKTTASPYLPTDPAMRIDRVVIEGGRWTVPRVNTDVNPFTIGLAWTDETYPASANNSGIVDIQDVIFEFDKLGSAGVKQGAPSQDCGSFFTTIEYGGGAVPAASIWGAVAVSANYLTMRNLKFFGMSQLSESGDLFIKADRSMSVDNLVFDDYKVSGPLTAPSNRLRLRLGNYSSSQLKSAFTISNVFMRGTDAAAGSWGTNIFSVEPNSSGGLSSLTSLEISGIQVSNFTVVGSPSATIGFRYVNALFGSLYTGSGGQFDRIHVSKLQMRDLLTGVQAFLTDSVLGTWSICDSEITDCTNGVFVLTTLEVGDLTFCRNKVHRNTTSGVYIGVGDWVTTTEVSPACIVANDNVIRNNPAASGVQMRIESTAVSGDHQPRGSVIGNSFSSDSSVDGNLKINRISGGSSVALVNPADPGATRNIRGVHTGHSLADANTLLYQNNFGMYCNQGNLVTP